jgi:hypothetical protein
MRRALIAAVAALLTLPAAAQAATHGAVGGLRDPAAGTLQLTVQAVETDGTGLRRATAILGGHTLDSQYFGDDPGCAPGACPTVATVALAVPTTAVADGPARLEVTVEDAAGSVTHVVDQTVTIANRPVVSNPTVVVTVGGGAKKPQTGPGTGGPAGPSGNDGCRSPRLSMFLAQRPLRIKRGVPVLAAGRKYRFRGRLTCVVDGRRKAAPRGTLVQVRDRRHGRSIVRPVARVKVGGAIVVKLAHRRSCSVIFRVRGAGGHLVSVRIPIRVVRAKGGRS